MNKSSVDNFIRSSALGELDQLRELLDQDPELTNTTDGDGRTALIHATLNNEVRAVGFLLERGANPDLRDRRGFGALHFAAQDYLPHVVSLLVSAGAAVDLVDVHGNSPLSKAVFNSRGRGEVIELLLGAGADPHLKNEHGVSPAELAESIANYPVARFFARS